MDKLISGLLNTALDAASSALRSDEDKSSPSRTTVDRSSWAEIAADHDGRTQDHRYNNLEQNSWKSGPPHQISSQENRNEGGWQKSDNTRRQQHRPDRYHKVSQEQGQEYRRPAHEQVFSKPVGADIDTEPTQEELQDISAACNRLWKLDLNRLTPGKDYEIDCGEGKRVSDRQDMAENAFFRYVNDDVFRRPTYARFYALLDNYTAKQGLQEHVTEEERQEETAFIEEIYRTAPIQYLFKYLTAQGVVSKSLVEFKKHLHSLWFGLYGRAGTSGSSSAFEHVFVGEVKGGGSEGEISGFHNWIKFYVEEAAGRVDYQGYIFPKRRNQSEPDAHSQCLSIQFTWNGVKKPVSSTLVGVSPEFELALYTLCFYGGAEDNHVQIGPYRVNVKCYHLGRDKLGSAFPILDC